MITSKKPIIRLIEVGNALPDEVGGSYKKPSRKNEFRFLGYDFMAAAGDKSLGIPTLQIDALSERLDTTGRDNGFVLTEILHEVQEFLGDGTDIVFVLSIHENRDGVSIASLISKKAKDLGVLTISVVYLPLSQEEGNNAMVTSEGLSEIKRSSDSTFFLIPDKPLGTGGHPNTKAVFQQAVESTLPLVKAFKNLLDIGGEVNVDLLDLRTVLSDAGDALVGSSKSSGPGRATRVIQEAMEFHHSLNKELSGVSRILLSIISGEGTDLEMEELTEITD